MRCAIVEAYNIRTRRYDVFFGLMARGERAHVIWNQLPGQNISSGCSVTLGPSAFRKLQKNLHNKDLRCVIHCHAGGEETHSGYVCPAVMAPFLEAAAVAAVALEEAAAAAVKHAPPSVVAAAGASSPEAVSAPSSPSTNGSLQR